MWTIVRILDWLSPAFDLAGLIICIWGYRLSRKKGYVLMAIYFALVLLSVVVLPLIHTNRTQASPYSDEVQQKIEAAVSEILDDEGPMEVRTLERSVYMPIGNILLVVGLWLVARTEKRKITEP